MKKLLKLCACAMMALVVVFSATACGGDPFEGKFTIVIAGETEQVYQIDSSELTVNDGGLDTVLKYLRDNKGLHLVASDSSYGMYIQEIGNITANASNNEYVCIYTSVEADKDTSSYLKTTEYQGVTLYTSGLGSSSMTIVDGCIIYFCIATY